MAALLMMALTGALTYECQVVLPVLAQQTFPGNTDAYGFLWQGAFSPWIGAMRVEWP